jgi:acyl carrier protein
VEAGTAGKVTPDVVIKRVIEALVELGPEPEQVHENATFEELDIDSLDMVEIAQILAQDFGIKMEPEDFEGVVTVGDAFGVIRGYVV